jgi:TrmH family RNA methyltransferase
MLSNNQIKYINSLKIKKFRQKYGTFIVEGEKGVSELLSSSLKAVKIFATPEWHVRNSSLFRHKDIELQKITLDELKKLSDLITPNQVLALAEIPDFRMPAPSEINSLSIVLDGIRDPGNMGTIIRTSDWFGINTVICSHDSVDAYHPKVIQATMGSFSRVNVYYTDLFDFLSNLPAKFPVYGALLKGENINQKTFEHRGIVLIGSESHGISPILLPYVNEPVHIPRFVHQKTKNLAESLNASIANGIICYEICKQLSKNNF